VRPRAVAVVGCGHSSAAWARLRDIGSQARRQAFLSKNKTMLVELTPPPDRPAARPPFFRRVLPGGARAPRRARESWWADRPAALAPACPPWCDCPSLAGCGPRRARLFHPPPPPPPPRPKPPKPNVEEAREVLSLPSNNCSFLRCAVPLCGANAKERDEGAQLDMRATRARDSIGEGNNLESIFEKTFDPVWRPPPRTPPAPQRTMLKKTRPGGLPRRETI
jgi:hypothetical protein